MHESNKHTSKEIKADRNMMVVVWLAGPVLRSGYNGAG
jgi:hypothetical protein